MEPRLDPALTHVHETAFLARGTVVMGDVHIGELASVWFGTVIRGDVEEIRIGNKSNLQDLTMVHADAGYPCIVGDEVTVGHRCILHGCKIGDRALIGMGATIMNGATIGAGAIIGAGALVPEGKEIPPGALVLGAPGRVKRDVTDAEKEGLVFSFEHYVAYGQAYKAAGHHQAPTGATIVS